MMSKNEGILALALVSIVRLETSHGFLTQQRQTSTRTTLSKHFDGNSPFREVDLDIDLAEDCVGNFGKYSFEEIEQCRDELHAHRVQSVALGDATSPDIIKERFLETELTMQLDRFKEEMPESYLFPEEDAFDFDVDTDVDFDGILMDNGLVAMGLPTRSTLQDPTTSKEKTQQMKMWKETIAAEGVLESIAICAMLGLLMMAPNLV